jgi:hypothetical protein
MATIEHARTAGSRPARNATASAVTASQQAFYILYAGFVLLPVLAGLDKFFHLLTNWDAYLAPVVTQIIPLSAHSFMLVVGAIEVVAGLLVLFRPQIGAPVVALWLWGIIVNLLLIPGFYDIAARDFGLSLGALALARLSHELKSPFAP